MITMIFCLEVFPGLKVTRSFIKKSWIRSFLFYRKNLVLLKISEMFVILNIICTISSYRWHSTNFVKLCKCRVHWMLQSKWRQHKFTTWKIGKCCRSIHYVLLKMFRKVDASGSVFVHPNEVALIITMQMAWMLHAYHLETSPHVYAWAHGRCCWSIHTENV